MAKQAAKGICPLGQVPSYLFTNTNFLSSVTESKSYVEEIVKVNKTDVA